MKRFRSARAIARAEKRKRFLTIRDVAVQFRVTPEERERLARCADADGRSLSNWARLALIKAAQEQENGCGTKHEPAVA